MALKDQVLKNFFDKRKVVPLISSKQFRVFDEPTCVPDTITIQAETRDKPKTKVETNERQSEDKQKSDWEQSEEKLEPKPETKVETNRRHKDLIRCSLTTYSSLSGLQRKITLFIYEQCKIARSDSTNQIAIEFLSTRCQTTTASAKKTIQRLIIKTIIDRIEYKDGRNGWSKYRLSNNVYQDILNEEAQSGFLISNNLRQTRDKQTLELETQLKTTASSSSSNIKNTTTMTQEGLPDEWKEIDISPLAEFNFHQGHLKQLFKHQCELEMVEKSIEYFAFDLTENQKHKTIQTDPINFFMGIMKRAGVYNAPPNYVDPRVKAKKQFLEQQAKQAEDLLMAEKELFDQYFLLWSEKLPKEEREVIIGNDLMSRSSSFQTIKLRDYYRDHFWREHYQKIQRGES
jgi:hypothetical protein